MNCFLSNMFAVGALTASSLLWGAAEPTAKFLRDLNLRKGSYPFMSESYEATPDGLYAKRDTLYYEITHLQRFSEIHDSENFEHWLYGDEDFVIPPKEDGREKVKAKIGKLFIEFQPGGKGSFLLSIKEIDRNNRSLKLFLNLEHPRYASFSFEHIIPLDRNAFYFDATLAVSHHTKNPHLLSQLYEMKKILTKFMLNEPITQEDRATFFKYYQQVYIPEQKQELPIDQLNQNSENRRDISFFGKNQKAVPLSLFEVAAKIGGIATWELSIGIEDIKSVLREYIKEKGLSFDYFMNKEIQKTILETILDDGKIGLKGLIDDDIEKLLDQASLDQYRDDDRLLIHTSKPSDILPFCPIVDQKIVDQKIVAQKKTQEELLSEVILNQANILECQAGEWFDLGNGLAIGLSNYSGQYPSLRFGDYEIQIRKEGTLTIYEKSSGYTLVTDDDWRDAIIAEALKLPFLS